MLATELLIVSYNITELSFVFIILFRYSFLFKMSQSVNVNLVAVWNFNSFFISQLC